MMKRAVNQPVGELVLFAGIFCKLWTVADRYTLLPQHSHEFPHISLLVQGEVRVWRDDELVGDFSAPAGIKIDAHTLHSFLTLSDNVTIACIHNADHADPDGEPVIAAENNLVMED